MKKSDVFFELPDTIKKDPLSEFIASFEFVPKAFGHQFNDSTAICDNRITADAEIIYIIGGESYITIQNQKYICYAGDLVVIPPFTMHKILTSDNNPHDNYWIHFDIFPVYKQTEFIYSLLNTNSHKSHIGVLDELIVLFNLFESEYLKNQPGFMTFSQNLLTQILVSIIRNTKSEISNSSTKYEIYGPEKNIVDNSITFINENITSRIKIADICNYLHISEAYLYKCFDKIVRMPPNYFIQMCKVKKAEQLIKSTTLSFKEISDRLGFSSPYYLCMDFYDYPEELKILCDISIRDFQKIYDHFDSILKSKGQLSVSWMNIPSYGKVHIPSCYKITQHSCL